MKEYKQLNRGVQILLFVLSPLLTYFLIGQWAVVSLLLGVVPMLLTAIASLTIRQLLKQDSIRANNISWILITCIVGFSITTIYATLLGVGEVIWFGLCCLVLSAIVCGFILLAETLNKKI